MVDITTIPIDKLQADLQETQKDIVVCSLALSQGVRFYSGGSVAARLAANGRVAEVILAEIGRRDRANNTSGGAANNTSE